MLQQHATNPMKNHSPPPPLPLPLPPPTHKLAVQDERILARKFADRWLYKALGSGLHGRVLHRKERGDPRMRLYSAVLLASQRSKNPKVGPPSELSSLLPAWQSAR